MASNVVPQSKKAGPRPSSWSLKVAMAVTGTVWVLFVLVHLFGNLKVFLGPESFNTYAHWLREAFYPLLPHGFVLWTLRIVLLTCLMIHVVAAVILWHRGRTSGFRQTRMAVWRAKRKGTSRLQALSASLMPVTGLAILAFIVMHVLDLTTGTNPVVSTQFQAPTPEASMAYQNLIASMQRPWMAFIYATVMVLLSIHVLHGVETAASDFGVVGHPWRVLAVWLAGFAALAVLLGNGSIPVLVQLGVLQ